MRQPVPERKKRTNTNFVRKNTRPTVIFRYCGYIACKNNSSHGCSFGRLPIMPTLLIKSSQHNKGLMNFAVRSYFRNECIDRCGLLRDNVGDNISICSDHKIEKITKNVEWLDKDGDKQTSTDVVMYVPKSFDARPDDINNNTAINQVNNGLGQDRALNQKIQSILNNIPKDGISESTITVLSQVIETTKGNLEAINPELLINICNSFKEQKPPPTKMKVILPTVIPKKYDDLTCKMKFQNQKFKDKRLNSFWDLNERLVRIKTGFTSPMAMLAYIIIINGGDIEKKQTTTVGKLTWLQEWMVFLEMVWGRSCGRWVDMEEAYGFHNRTVRNIFDDKLDLVNNAIKMAKICYFDRRFEIKTRRKVERI
jgi:hypothetical protein